MHVHREQTQQKPEVLDEKWETPKVETFMGKI
jgi:hypothetical protein